MGARPQDYERAAPYKSYIHVDDFEGPKELAEFLKKLEENDDQYNEYFRWKVSYTTLMFFCIQSLSSALKWPNPNDLRSSAFRVRVK